MANKSSFFLALLFIANPFMLLFFQNCASIPQASKGLEPDTKQTTPAPADQTKEVVEYKFKKAF